MHVQAHRDAPGCLASMPLELQWAGQKVHSYPITAVVALQLPEYPHARGVLARLTSQGVVGVPSGICPGQQQAHILPASRVLAPPPPPWKPLLICSSAWPRRCSPETVFGKSQVPNVRLVPGMEVQWHHMCSTPYTHPEGSYDQGHPRGTNETLGAEQTYQGLSRDMPSCLPWCPNPPPCRA